jgi:hypothetical protein
MQYDCRTQCQTHHEFEQNIEGQYCEQTMRVFVQSLTGRNVPIYVHASDKIERLKVIIAQSVHDTVLDQQRLVFEGKQLEEGRTVTSYGINVDSKIHLILRLRAIGQWKPAALGAPATVERLLDDDPAELAAIVTAPSSSFDTR